MKKLDNIIKSITDEYINFISEEIKKSKEELIEDSGKIDFYKNIKNYFEVCEVERDYYINKIIKSKSYIDKDNHFQNINLISFLWDCYISSDYLYATSFEGIEQIIDFATM